MGDMWVTNIAWWVRTGVTWLAFLVVSVIAVIVVVGIPLAAVASSPCGFGLSFDLVSMVRFAKRMATESSPEWEVAATEEVYANLATSVDDVMEKVAELRAAKRRKTEADQAVAGLKQQQNDLEDRLATAKSDRAKSQNEERYCAGELAIACKYWLAHNKA